MEGIEHARAAGQRKLCEIVQDQRESNLLQSKLAILLFNRKQRKIGAPVIGSLNRGEWNDADKQLFHHAFTEWTTTTAGEKWPSLSFREYIEQRHPDQKVDPNDPVDVETLFMAMFEEDARNEHTEATKKLVAENMF